MLLLKKEFIKLSYKESNDEILLDHELIVLLKDKLDQLISFVSKNRELNFNGSKYNKIENYYLAKDYLLAFTQLFNHTVTLTDDQKYQLELNAYENINIIIKFRM